MSSRTGTGGRRSCTDGPTERRWEGVHRSCCKRFFQRHSRTSERNCCGPTVGRASLRRPKRTERRWWWRADGPCGATSRNDPPPLELAKRSAELESINKELEAFAYSISHDLRAPLRHMAGYTELLQKKASSVVDEKSNHYVL